MFTVHNTRLKYATHLSKILLHDSRPQVAYSVNYIIENDK